MSERTFKVGLDAHNEFMHGDDVVLWQQALRSQYRDFNWDAEKIKIDGVYGPATRSATSMVLKGLGIAQTEMVHGVTPELRIKVRNQHLSYAEIARRVRRRAWVISSPLRVIEADTWGYHPPTHDGLDLICPKDSVLYAMVRSQVIRVSDGGWWGKAPSGDVKLGDGIVMLECLDRVGPFRPGMVFGYGHAEHARVKVGRTVKAGQPIAMAGVAVVPHVHLMAAPNVGSLGRLADGTPRGIGTIDPAPLYRYARKHG
jgi:murein DD-endopeptidase MepM/ murein hydrolase activator NlpD